MRVKPPITQLRTSFERREASIHKPNRHRNSHTSLPPECSHDLDYQMQPNKWAGKSIPIEVRYKHKRPLQQTEVSEAPSLLLVLRVYKVCG